MRSFIKINKMLINQNVFTISQMTNSKLIIPVKANAYGHGLKQILESLYNNEKIWGFAVAYPQEAFEAREILNNLKSDQNILLMGNSFQEEWKNLVDKNIEFTITDDDIKKLEKIPNNAKVHLKINTGMNRLGILPENSKKIIDFLHNKDVLSGIYSHFSSSDFDIEVTKQQYLLFLDVIKDISYELHFHILNSSAILNYNLIKDIKNNLKDEKLINASNSIKLARPGILTYGIWGLNPVLSLYSMITRVYFAKKGEKVSYNGLVILEKDTKLAIASIGYADGYPRNASLKAEIAFNNKKAKILGRICMDQIIIDASELDIKEGDLIEIIGNNISIEKIANWSDMSPYEVVSRLSSRIRRDVY